MSVAVCAWVKHRGILLLCGLMCCRGNQSSLTVADHGNVDNAHSPDCGWWHWNRLQEMVWTHQGQHSWQRWPVK